MYTRSYGTRQNTLPRILPPDYGGTALVISQPEPAPPPAIPITPQDSMPTQDSVPERPPQPTASPAAPPPPRRSRFTGRRRPIVTSPSMPRDPDYDARRDTEGEPPPAARRDPLGAPPFGGGAEPYGGGGQPFYSADVPETALCREEKEGAPHDGEGHPFPALSLKQDDLLLLGLLLFLLHEQDEEDTDCRDALLLLAVLFVAGL